MCTTPGRGVSFKTMLGGPTIHVSPPALNLLRDQCLDSHFERRGQFVLLRWGLWRDVHAKDEGRVAGPPHRNEFLSRAVQIPGAS